MNIWRQYDDIGPDYIAGQSDFFSAREDWGRDVMADFMGRDLHDKVIVDMGCGHGPDAKAYLEMGARRVIGVDPSEFMLAQARSLVSGAEFRSGNFGHIPVADARSVDIVASRYSIHYMDDLDGAYEESARVLKPGGLLMFLAPHPMGDFFLEREKDGERELVVARLYDNRVAVRYPLHTLQEYFSDTFFALFALEAFREFQQEEKQLELAVPTAMVIRARKR
jgi:ubiquinone/menaquinone biosynthesis C-methylase UbiE